MSYILLRKSTSTYYIYDRREGRWECMAIETRRDDTWSIEEVCLDIQKQLIGIKRRQYALRRLHQTV